MEKSGVREFANRCYIMYELYNKFNHTNKSRKRKEYLRKIFKAWYKCPDWEGNYNEQYWQFITKFNDEETFRVFLWNYNKCLTNKQVIILLKEMEKRVKNN